MTISAEFGSKVSRYSLICSGLALAPCPLRTCISGAGRAITYAAFPFLRRADHLLLPFCPRHHRSAAPRPLELPCVDGSVFVAAVVTTAVLRPRHRHRLQNDGSSISHRSCKTSLLVERYSSSSSNMYNISEL